MDKVWMERGAFLDHEAEFLSNTLKGLAANYTIIMRAAKGEDEADHLNAMQTRIEEIVKAEFETLKNALCEEDGAGDKKTILSPEERANKIKANMYFLANPVIVDNTTARDMLEDAESCEILEALEEFKGTEISWLNYWDGVRSMSEKSLFNKGDVVYEVATLLPTERRKEAYSVVVRPTGFVWTIVDAKNLTPVVAV